MQKKSLTIIGILSLLLVLGVFLFVSACSSSPSSTPTAPASAAKTTPSVATPASKAIVLKAVGPYPPSKTTAVRAIQDVADLLNQRSNGRLSINWIGGPEAIAANDQPTALRNGSVDFLATATSYYQNLVPQVSVANLCQYSAAEQRTKGIYDYWDKIHRQSLNAHFLGFANFGGGYFLYVNKEIKDPRTDFKGLKIRSSTLYDGFVKALGAVPTTVAADESYSALQTKIVDGAGWLPEQILTNKAYEVCKYWVNQSFYATTFDMLINLNTWNSLPKDLQDLLETACHDVEVSDIAYFANQVIEDEKLFQDKGMKPITLSQADADWYVKLADDTKWNDAKKVISQEDWDMLNKMLNK